MKVSQSELSIDNVLTVNKRQGNMCICCWSCDPLSASHSSALSMIKYKKTYQFTTQCKSNWITHPKQHKSFSGIMWQNDLIAIMIHLT